MYEKDRDKMRKRNSPILEAHPMIVMLLSLILGLLITTTFAFHNMFENLPGYFFICMSTVIIFYLIFFMKPEVGKR